MKNTSAGKVTHGPNNTPKLSSPTPPAVTNSPKMPNVGGHVTNTGNGKQGV